MLCVTSSALCMHLDILSHWRIFWLLQPCGGAIPLCMVDEFDIPAEIIDRKVTKMKMISPSNREVDVGKTLSETEYIGMCRREVLDAYLRNRAKEYGATVHNGLFMRMEQVCDPCGHASLWLLSAGVIVCKVGQPLLMLYSPNSLLSQSS